MENFDFGIQSNGFPGDEFKALELFIAVLSFPGVKSRKYPFGDGQLVHVQSCHVPVLVVAGSYLQNVRLDPLRPSARFCIDFSGEGNST